MNSARVEKSADKLLKIMEKRYKKESAYVLTENDKDAIWFHFFGRLTRGESERELIASCQIVKLK